MKYFISHLHEQFEKCVSRLSSKWRLFFFFVIAFFVAIGIFSSLRLAIEHTSPLRLIQNEPEATKPVVSPSLYPSQPISIDVPFSDTALLINEPRFPDRICSIDDFGAIADGKTKNTDAFRKAIESCADQGGGKVLVPAGTWLTGPIHLKSNIELHIERNATVLFSTNPSDYLPVVFSRFEGIEYYNYSPPLYTADATNVAITGVGTLDGQGDVTWWKWKNRATPNISNLYAQGDNNLPLDKRIYGNESAGLRPSFIEFVNCQNVLIQDVKIVDGPMWTIHPLYSDNVIIRGVDIETNPGPSTDGVAVDSSSRVLIENSTFNTGDDAIVLKSGRDKGGMRLHRPTENVVIRNNTIRDAHASVAIGSEMSGDVRNVFATDMSIDTVQFGLRIKATIGRGGIVENIWAQNFTMRHATIEAIQITTNYGLPSGNDNTAIPTFRNIHIKDISVAQTSQAVSINGLPQLPISDVLIEGITFGTKDGIELKNVDGVHFKNIQFTQKKDLPLFILADAKNVSIDTAPCLSRTSVCLTVQGEISENIDIKQSGFEKTRTQSSPDTNPDALIY